MIHTSIPVLIQRDRVLSLVVVAGKRWKRMSPAWSYRSRQAPLNPTSARNPPLLGLPFAEGGTGTTSAGPEESSLPTASTAAPPAAVRHQSVWGAMLRRI